MLPNSSQDVKPTTLTQDAASFLDAILDTPKDQVTPLSPAATSLLTELEPQESSGSNTADTASTDYQPTGSYGVSAPTQEEVSFRHSGWMPRRRRIIAAHIAAGKDKAAEGIACCGSSAHVWMKDTGEVEVRSHTCKSRWCLPCMQHRSWQVSQVIRAHARKRLEQGAHLRFLTLTLKHSARPLTDQLEHLSAAWRALRHTKEWKARVTGGVAVIELKRSQAGRWHPHIHIIAEGAFWPKGELSRLWLNATGSSFITHIRDIGEQGQAVSVDKACGYVTKYVTKAADSTCENEPAALQEIIKALAGRRSFDKLGSWRSLDLEPQDDDTTGDDDAHWTHLGSLTEIIQRARTADARSLDILLMLKRKRNQLETSPPGSSGDS